MSKNFSPRFARISKNIFSALRAKEVFQKNFSALRAKKKRVGISRSVGYLRDARFRSDTVIFGSFWNEQKKTAGMHGVLLFEVVNTMLFWTTFAYGFSWHSNGLKCCYLWRGTYGSYSSALRVGVTRQRI